MLCGELLSRSVSWFSSKSRYPLSLPINSDSEHSDTRLYKYLLFNKRDNWRHTPNSAHLNTDHLTTPHIEDGLISNPFFHYTCGNLLHVTFETCRWCSVIKQLKKRKTLNNRSPHGTLMQHRYRFKPYVTAQQEVISQHKASINLPSRNTGTYSTGNWPCLWAGLDVTVNLASTGIQSLDHTAPWRGTVLTELLRPIVFVYRKQYYFTLRLPSDSYSIE